MLTDPRHLSSRWKQPRRRKISLVLEHGRFAEHLITSSSRNIYENPSWRFRVVRETGREITPMTVDAIMTRERTDKRFVLIPRGRAAKSNEAAARSVMLQLSIGCNVKSWPVERSVCPANSIRRCNLPDEEGLLVYSSRMFLYSHSHRLDMGNENVCRRGTLLGISEKYTRS